MSRVVTIFLRGAMLRSAQVPGARWDGTQIEVIDVSAGADLLFDEAGVVIQTGGDQFGGYRAKRHLPWWRIIEIQQESTEVKP